MAFGHIPNRRAALSEDIWLEPYRAALQRFEKIAREYANVGLDYKVTYFIAETKRLMAEADAKMKKTAEKK